MSPARSLVAQLRGQAVRLRANASFMTAALRELQARLDHWLREASALQLRGAQDRAAPMLARSNALQGQYDELASELARVRVALRGVDDELARRRSS